MELYDFRDYCEIAARNLRKIAMLSLEFEVPLTFLNFPSLELPSNPISENEYYPTAAGYGVMARAAFDALLAHGPAEAAPER